MIKISATIVAYNNYKDIKNAIESIEKYTNIDRIIYIVDNGVNISDPDEVEEFKKFIGKYKNIDYLDTGTNLGFGRGHNYILSRLDSEYHAIINPDILFVEDSFSKIIRYMDNRLDIGAVIPLITDENGKIQWVYRQELTVLDMAIRLFCKDLFAKRTAKHTMQDKDYTKEFQVPFGQGSFIVFRTELFKRIGGFDNNFFMYVEDADICKRVNQMSKLMYFPETRVIHKWKKESHKNRTLFKYHIQSTVYYFKKWGYKLF